MDELKCWQAGEAPVLAVQIDSGGVGVDLTRARYAIYYSLGFSLGSYEQSLARIHRPGQTRPVEYIHLVAEGTVDEKVMAALARRADVVNTVLHEMKGLP
jgi:SNF2 family DNA or RNA helicase